MPTLDITYTRSTFPAFQNPLPASTAFFENAGGSYPAGAVLTKLFHFYSANKVQPFGDSKIARAATEQMEAGRRVMAEVLGVPSDTVTLGPSTTQNINTLAIACTAIVSRGDTVIVSAQDHEANIGAWERLCKRSGAEFVLWQVDATSGELSLDALAALFKKHSRVKLLCMTQSSNIIGTLNPVSQAKKLCRENGARIVVDGVSFAPHQMPDIPALQPDAYCFSTYKTYATHLGVMYLAPDFAAQLDPQCHYFNTDFPAKRMDAAGPDHAAIAALAGLGEYFADSYRHHFGDDDSKSLFEKTSAMSTLMHNYEIELCTPLLKALRELPVRIIGRDTMQQREANISFTSQHHSPQHIASQLAARDIAVGAGHFYAKRLLDAVGEGEAVRISFSHYNTVDEVAKLINALREIYNQ